jgi:N-glycosylase/DNA lyase
VGVLPQGFIAYPIDDWDIGLCVTSGQVFRWERRGDAWVGVDGPTVMWLRPKEGGVEWATFPEPGREDRIRGLFRLEVPLGEVKRRILDAEPALAPDIARFPGLRVLRWDSTEECLLSFLCSVNNNIPRITSMISKLAAHFGAPLALGLNALPTAETLAASATEAGLRELGFGYRARTILLAARNLSDCGRGWCESLSALPYEEAHAALLTVPGVGRKVADCVCLFGLGHTRAVPVDTHLWQACLERYFPEWRGRSLTDMRYRRIGDHFRERFGDLAGWAHQYLFYGRVAGPTSAGERASTRSAGTRSGRSSEQTGS